jgi:hypothetical protein
LGARGQPRRAEQPATQVEGEQSSQWWQSQYQEAAEGEESWAVVELGAGALEVVGFTVTLMGCEPGPVFHELQPSNKEPSRFPSHPAG